MAINNMTVGKDYTFAFYDPNTGAIIDFGDVQNVRLTAMKHDIKSMPYNDVPRFGYIPDGYSFSMTLVRTNSNLENYQLAQNVLFNQGSSSVSGYLNETVTNPDGSVNRYQYIGVVVWVSDIGEISRDTTVKMTVEGKASDKISIA